MKTIKIMADYHCFPLWEASDDEIGNIDPSSLPLSQQLRDDLITWAQLYDQTLNLEDPMNSGFASSRAEDDFKAAGRDLAKRMRTELGGAYRVVEKI